MNNTPLSFPRSVDEINPLTSEHLETICSFALFSGLSERDVAPIASAAVRRTYARHDTLFTQGHEIRNLILLESGSVKHSQVSSKGEEVLLRMSGAGDLVAGEALSASCRHNCSALATQESKALIWGTGQIQTYLATYPTLNINMGRILSARLSELEERFRELATERVATRVALLLLRLCTQMGKHSGNGIRISLNREEIAQMAGVSMFTISRMFSRWSDRGLIFTPREAVVVRDPRRLEVSEATTAARRRGPY